MSISPGTEVYVQEGSQLKLQCRIQGCPHADPYWTRDGQRLENLPKLVLPTPVPPTTKPIPAYTNESMPRGGLLAPDEVSVAKRSAETNPQVKSEPGKDTKNLTMSEEPNDFEDSSAGPVAVANLTRSDVTTKHSGIYICASTCTLPVNVTVHVVRGKCTGRNIQDKKCITNIF